jgi:hypothetical protein
VIKSLLLFGVGIVILGVVLVHHEEPRGGELGQSPTIEDIKREVERQIRKSELRAKARRIEAENLRRLREEIMRYLRETETQEA